MLRLKNSTCQNLKAQQESKRVRTTGVGCFKVYIMKFKLKASKVSNKGRFLGCVFRGSNRDYKFLICRYDRDRGLYYRTVENDFGKEESNISYPEDVIIKSFEDGTWELISN